MKYEDETKRKLDGPEGPDRRQQEAGLFKENKFRPRCIKVIFCKEPQRRAGSLNDGMQHEEQTEKNTIRSTSKRKNLRFYFPKAQRDFTAASGKQATGKIGNIQEAERREAI